MNIWRNAAPFAKIFELIFAQIRDANLIYASDFFLKIIFKTDLVVQRLRISITCDDLKLRSEMIRNGNLVSCTCMNTHE